MKGMKKPERKIVFEYDNYRTFLKDTYDAAKELDRRFSYRYFAKLFEFSSPNYVKRVIEGDRNLSLPAIERCIVGLKLKIEEGDYFRNLVLFNQAKSAEERNVYAARLVKSSLRRKAKPLSESQFN